MIFCGFTLVITFVCGCVFACCCSLFNSIHILVTRVSKNAEPELKLLNVYFADQFSLDFLIFVTLMILFVSSDCMYKIRAPLLLSFLPSGLEIKNCPVLASSC